MRVSDGVGDSGKVNIGYWLFINKQPIANGFFYA